MNPEETAPATETETPAAETETTDQQILEAINETNRLLAVIAEQDRNAEETQTEHGTKLDNIAKLLQPDEGSETSTTDQTTLLQEISSHTATTLEKLDGMNNQNYETGWLLTFVIIFAIGFKAFMDHSTRW